MTQINTALVEYISNLVKTAKPDFEINIFENRLRNPEIVSIGVWCRGGLYDFIELNEDLNVIRDCDGSRYRHNMVPLDLTDDNQVFRILDHIEEIQTADIIYL